MGIYVETRIRGSLEEVWERTQNPAEHERWDLRFTTITYLPRERDDEPQRFRYATRLGCGLEISGWGETVGETREDGSRSSALRFGSESPLSLIREGSGFWKYEHSTDGLRFITGYDYEVRWGAFGSLIDRLFFRPLMGWATAWSFDRLRLWIERRVDPREAALRASIHACATAGVAFTWAWHGLVPKLLGPHADELALMADAGIPVDLCHGAVLLLGGIELCFGLAFPWISRWRWPWIVTVLVMVVGTLSVVLHSPGYVVAAFNPVSLNVLLGLLALVGLRVNRELPSAGHSRRKPPARERTP